MGIMDTLRSALAIPAIANGSLAVPYESPFIEDSHLIKIDPPRYDRAVTRAAAMSVPAVAKARRLIVGSIARCDLQARTDGKPVENQPIWITRTDGIQSPHARMTWTVDDLMFYGMSLWGLERNFDGAVTRATRIPYDYWDLNQEGNVIINGKIVDPKEVCLIVGPDEGLLRFGATAIRHAIRLANASDTAAHTPSPTLKLKQTNGAPLNNQQIKDLVNSWIAARRGENGGVAFLNQSIDAEEMGKVDPALLIDGRNAAAVDIARATGVPSTLIDAAVGQAGNVTYANQMNRNVELVDHALAPYMSAIAGRLGLDDMVPRGWAVAFDLTDLTSNTIGDVDVQDDDRQNYDDENPNVTVTKQQDKGV